MDHASTHGDHERQPFASPHERGAPEAETDPLCPDVRNQVDLSNPPRLPPVEPGPREQTAESVNHRTRLRLETSGLLRPS